MCLRGGGRCCIATLTSSFRTRNPCQRGHERDERDKQHTCTSVRVSVGERDISETSRTLACLAAALETGCRERLWRQAVDIGCRERLASLTEGDQWRKPLPPPLNRGGHQRPEP